MNEDTEYINHVYESIKYSTEQFDKNLVFIASGGLAISFAFIKDIVSLSDSNHNWILISSWIVLALVIFTSLLSHHFSIKALRWGAENINKKTNDYKRGQEKHNKPIATLNLMSILGIIIGFITLLIFISLNILK